MLTPEDAQRFSQVKGRDMKAFFVDNQLSQINVKGNGESIYYARDEKKAYVGVNKISSTDIKISVKDRKIDRINFIKEPDAILTPIKDASPMDFLLQGFKNRTSERPTVQIAEWQPIQLPSDFTPKKLESKSKSGKKTKKKK
ncbi:MAG: hypothetical protein NTX03_13820 [Bacteroidetes bacterium]|nr:hypothetical protein [Bacteroidota bacterium]